MERGREDSFTTFLHFETWKVSSPSSLRLTPTVGFSGLSDPPLLCPSLQPQRLRGAEADWHEQEILHELQAVVPEEDLREVNVSTREPSGVTPKPKRRQLLGGGSKRCSRHWVNLCCVCAKGCFSLSLAKKKLCLVFFPIDKQDSETLQC